MTILILAYVCLLLHDYEPEYPLFHPQDNENNGGNGAYYLCYRYPRPNYWIHRGRRLLRRLELVQD